MTYLPINHKVNCDILSQDMKNLYFEKIQKLNTKANSCKFYTLFSFQSKKFKLLKNSGGSDFCYSRGPAKTETITVSDNIFDILDKIEQIISKIEGL